jgi:hypothetical protein
LCVLCVCVCMCLCACACVCVCVCVCVSLYLGVGIHTDVLPMFTSSVYMYDHRHEEVPALYHTYQFVFGKKIGVVRLHPVLARVLVDAPDVRDVIHGRMLPMLVPPRPWLSYDSGGYLTVDRTCTQACLFVCLCVCHIHAHTLTHIHTYIHTHTHSLTHAHTACLCLRRPVHACERVAGATCAFATGVPARSTGRCSCRPRRAWHYPVAD